MKEKKQSKNWNIAATHYLTAGFAIPFIINLVLGFPITTLIGEDNQTLLTFTTSIIWIFGIWPGVIYSANYVNKTYIIKNSGNIVKLATIYFGVLNGVVGLLFLPLSITNLIIHALSFIVGITVFYILSNSK